MSLPLLGLIAGQGRFPLEVARAANRRGQRLLCLALRGLTEPAIEDEVAEIVWIHLGEAAAGIASFHKAGISEAVMAGKVPKNLLLGDTQSLRFDGDAKHVMDALGDRKDDTILGAIADFLEKTGIRLLPQWALSPDLLAGAGPLGSVALTEEQRADVAFGFPIAKKLGELDIGQTVVVRGRAVLAVEAIEGTDATIRRAGEISPRGCVVKVAKPGQDPRFDVPTIGVGTVDSLLAAGAEVLAFEAGATIVLEREEVSRRADAARIAIVGIDPGELLR